MSKPRKGWASAAEEAAYDPDYRRMATGLYSAVERMNTLAALISDIEVFGNRTLSAKLDALSSAIQTIATVAMKENEV